MVSGAAVEVTKAIGADDFSMHVTMYGLVKTDHLTNERQPMKLSKYDWPSYATVPATCCSLCQHVLMEAFQFFVSAFRFQFRILIAPCCLLIIFLTVLK